MASLSKSFNYLKESFTAPLNKAGVKSFAENLVEHTLDGKGAVGKVAGALMDVVHTPFKLIGAGAKPIAKVTMAISAATGAVVGGAVAHSTVTIAKQPVAGVMRVTGKIVRSLRGHPYVVAGAGLAAGAYALLNWNNARAAHATHVELESQARSAQADVAAVAAASGQNYMNSVTPADMAAMNARMEADGKAAPAHAAAVAAARTPLTEGQVAAL
ncbi:MAG: hypothetical protein ACOYNL_04155 [Rickettsiales bacterium]